MSFNLENIRRDTPACETLLHFNNAGASLMPRPVYEAMTHYLALEQSIGGYEAAAASQDKIESFYEVMARLLGANPSEIAFIENATRAWDMAVCALNFSPGDRVLVHHTEYASNYLGLLHLCKEKQIEIDFVPSTKDGLIDCEALEQLIVPATKAVFLTHIPSHSGGVNPAETVGKITRRHKLIYVLDACQSVGQRRVDVKLIGCDILCGTGRKFMRGPRGTGFLYVSHRILADLQPPFVDLQAAEWSSTHGYTLRPDARRFETWERFMAGQIALAEAARYALDIGMEAIEHQVQTLAKALRATLKPMPHITLVNVGDDVSGIVAFEVAGLTASECVQKLRAHKINCSAAKVEHTRLDMERRGVVSLVRASVHYYISEDDVWRFCEAVDTLRATEIRLPL